MAKKLPVLPIIAALFVVLSGCSAAAPQATVTPVPPTATAAPTRVEITLNDFTVQSSTTEFQAGKTYEFVITNNGTLEHEFRIIPPAEGGMDMHSDDMHDEALLIVPVEELQPGASKTVEFTFPADSADETLEFSCHTPGHYEAGMKQTISVTQ